MKTNLNRARVRDLRRTQVRDGDGGGVGLGFGASPATVAESTGERRTATAWIARTTSPTFDAAATASWVAAAGARARRGRWLTAARWVAAAGAR